MKKLISIGFTALTLISAFAVLDIVPVTMVKAATNPPYDLWDGIAGNGIWGTDGEWTLGLGDVITYTYPTPHTIIVNGNLTIMQGSSLTLRGVTLKMATPYNGTFGITVENTANPSSLFWPELIIENEGATPSIITSNITDGKHRFGFVVEAPSLLDPFGPSFTMRNSELHECGWDFNETAYTDGGLWIGTSNATIENNDISDNYAGIILHGAGVRDVTITGNHIYDNSFAPGIYLNETISTSQSPIIIGPNNNIENNYWGVHIRSSLNINVHNNTIQSNGKSGESGGLIVDSDGTGISSDIYIQDNTIDNNAEYSLDVKYANDIHVLHNSLNGSTFTYFRPPISGLEIRNNNICQGGVNATFAYLVIGSSTKTITSAILDNNVISNNAGMGAIINFAQIDITNNRIENNPSHGIGLISGSFDSVINNNIFRSNGDTGLLLVANNIEVTNNIFEGNGDGTPYGNNPVFQDSGMSIMNSDGIYLYNNQFIQNVRTTGPDQVNGIYLLKSQNIKMESNTMYKNNNNLHCRGDSTYIQDNNSTYTWSGLLNNYDVYLEDGYLKDPSQPTPYGPNHVTFLNVSFDKSRVYIEDSISGDLTVQWYLHILVINSSGPVASANVTVSDNVNGTWTQKYVTDSRGRANWIVVTEYIRNKLDWVYYTPHKITASKGSEIGYAEPFIDFSKYVIVDIFLSPPQPGPPVPPTNFSISLLGTNLELTWSPSPDDGGGENDVKGYVIYRASLVNGSYVNVSFVSSGLPTYSWLDSGKGDLDWNNYFYIVRAKDMDDLEDDNENKVGKFVNSLAQGWNMISVPLVQSNTTREHVLQTIENNYATVQGYHAGKSRPWLHWHRWKPNYFNDVIEINHKNGYYIDMIIADHLVVVGKVAPQVDITLKCGWNLVGYPCLTDQLRDDALSSISGKYNIVEYYDTVKDREVRLGPNDYMKPGLGYWIHATQDCTWTITN